MLRRWARIYGEDALVDSRGRHAELVACRAGSCGGCQEELQVCGRRLGQVDAGTPDHERKKSLSCGAAKAVWNDLLIWLVLRSISRLQGEPLG